MLFVKISWKNILYETVDFQLENKKNVLMMHNSVKLYQSFLKCQTEFKRTETKSPVNPSFDLQVF